MIRRARLIFSLAAVFAVLPATAWAHGPVRKGMEIDRAMTLSMYTSQCNCDWRWYTIGLQAPGTVDVTARVQTFQHVTGPTYGVVVTLIRGAQDIASQQVSCASTRLHCRQSAQLRYRVSHSGAYYILVRGMGGYGIVYSLHVRGSIYALRCRTYC